LVHSFKKKLKKKPKIFFKIQLKIKKIFYNAKKFFGGRLQCQKRLKKNSASFAAWILSLPIRAKFFVLNLAA